MAEDAHQSGHNKEARELGADMAGALIGGVVGLVGGPVGAMGGAALGVAVQHAANAVMGRLGERQERRVEAVIYLMDQDVRRRKQRGEEPRHDGFFDERGALRPEAGDLLEAILRQAAQTHEERKLPFLARLYSAVEYDPTISASDALYLVRVAGELTYRQFVALSVYANHDEHLRALANAHVYHETGRAEPDEGILLELSNLVDLRLLGVSSNGVVGPLNNVFAGLMTRAKTSYGQLGLLPGGERLARMTGADEIDTAERQKWLEELTGRLTEQIAGSERPRS
jgi:hypothetical protein